MRILPRHLRDLIHVTDIAADHRNLFELSPMAANIAFIEVLKHWPLYGASFFDVTVSARFKEKVTSLFSWFAFHCSKIDTVSGLPWITICFILTAELRRFATEVYLASCVTNGNTPHGTQRPGNMEFPSHILIIRLPSLNQIHPHSFLFCSKNNFRISSQRLLTRR